jgi:hypothetical protein
LFVLIGTSGKVSKDEYLEKFKNIADDEGGTTDPETAKQYKEDVIFEGKKFDWADTNKDGGVDLDEFFDLAYPDLSERKKGFQLMEVAHYISQHDKDGTSTLSMEEFNTVGVVAGVLTLLE